MNVNRLVLFLLFSSSITLSLFSQRHIETAINSSNLLDLAHYELIDSFYTQRDFVSILPNYLRNRTLIELPIENRAENYARKKGSKARAEFELMAVDELLSKYELLNEGYIKDEERQVGYTSGAGFFYPKKQLDLWAVLAQFSNTTSFEVFNTIAIESDGYKSLVFVRDMYQNVVNDGGWDSILIQATDTFRLGDRNQVIANLRHRLIATLDLKSTDKINSQIFDKNVESALFTFQKRHLIDTTKVLDYATMQVLNVSAEERLMQIELNIEKWKWLPSSLGDYYVWSNIPSFSTELIEDNKRIAYHKTVVGKPTRATPLFLDTMTYLDIHPTWTVPPTILKNDIVPNGSSSYLRRKNITVINAVSGKSVPRDSIDWSNYKRYKFIQGAGPSNALGQVKFIFPNDHYIFIHDTPTKSHFSLQDRAYSSGCMRIENPDEFAYTLLRYDEVYTVEVLDSLWERKKTKRIVLDKRPFVYLTYHTVVVEPDGNVYFYKDVYGYDALLREKLIAIQKL